MQLKGRPPGHLSVMKMQQQCSLMLARPLSSVCAASEMGSTASAARVVLSEANDLAHGHLGDLLL